MRDFFSGLSSCRALATIEPRPAPQKNTRWLVTGGTGFLGQTIVARLVSSGARARSFDVNPPSASAVLGVEYVTGDVRDPKAVEAAARDVDYVIHAAAALPIHRSKKFIHGVNVDGMRNVLRAASQNKVRGVVFTSSTAVYGLHKYHPILETSPMKPVGPYGVSKVLAEQLCREYRERGLHVGILRCKTFLGPGRLGVFEILFDWIRRGKRIYTLGKGNNRYQLLDVQDLVDGIILAAQTPAGNDDYNLGADRYLTIKKDLEAVIAHAGTTSRVTALPRLTSKFALFVLDKLRLSPLTRWHYGTMDRESYVDITKATTKLQWRPRRSNSETLIDSYDWYIAHLGDIQGHTGTTHTVAWNQRALRWLRGIS
jgi:nucleoside-diphosphate-sugar epimerase